MFEERQRFRKGWLWLVIIPLIGLFTFGLITQFILKKAFTDNPVQDFALLGLSVLFISLIILFLKIELLTKIDEKGVHYKFYPFHKNFRVIFWDDIEKIYIRKYKPLSEYGGWGMRNSKNGKAYTVSGRHGLQLALKDGRKLLIGTLKYSQLQKTLEEAHKVKH